MSFTGGDERRERAYLTAVAAAAGGNMPEGKGTAGSATAERRDEGATGEKRTVEDLADEVRLLGVGRVGRPTLGTLCKCLLGHDGRGMVLHPMA